MLKEAIGEVCKNAPHYDKDGNAEMSARDEGIKRVAAALQAHVEDESSVGSLPFEVHIQSGGRKGKYGPIAWVRLYSKAHSPSAKHGHYLVYLFAADGSTIYLSLNQGTSERRPGSPRPVKGGAQLRSMATEARHLLKEWTTSPRFSRAEIGIDLGSSHMSHLSDYSLGRIRNYEDANIIAFRYNTETIPNDGILLQDLSDMLPLL